MVNTQVSLHSHERTVSVRADIVCIPQVVKKSSVGGRLGHQLEVFCLVGWFYLF